MCNRDMMHKFNHLILHSGAHLIPVNEHTLRQMTFEAKYAALHAIGLCLVAEIAKEKTEKVTGEWVNSGIVYDAQDARILNLGAVKSLVWEKCVPLYVLDIY